MTDTLLVPKEAIAEDRRLEKVTTSASEALMQHRWHWTLDESNPKRVPIRAYARAVGKGEATIRQYAKGFVLARSSPRMEAIEALRRAGMGAETEAAADAIAKARGTKIGTVKQNRPTEIKRVRDMARERAEKNETTVEEEATKVADWIVRSEKAQTKQTQERKQKLGLRYVEMEGKLERMKRIGGDVLNLAHDVDFGEEEMELLRHSLESIRKLLNLIDMRLAGAPDIDWDAEFARLEVG